MEGHPEGGKGGKTGVCVYLCVPPHAFIHERVCVCGVAGGCGGYSRSYL